MKNPSKKPALHATSTPSNVRKGPPPPPMETRWKPGQSGNPNGRPPTVKSIPDILRTIGDGPASPDIIKVTKARFPNIDEKTLNARQAMLYTAYHQAEHGDKDAREFIATRTEGKIKDVVQITDDRIVVRADLPELPIPTGEMVGDENGTTPTPIN